MKGLMDAKAVADRLGITVSALNKLAVRKKRDGTITLPSKWFAGRRCWETATIDAYLKDEAAQRRRRQVAATQRKFDLDEPAATRQQLAIDAQSPIGKLNLNEMVYKASDGSEHRI